MSEHYVKVDEVEVVESSNSTAVIILVVAILAITIIAMVMWQPWVAPQPQSNSTTIIRDQASPPPDNRPIIVNPPAIQGDTKVDIHNEVPPAKDPPIIDNSNNSATNDSNVGNNEPK